MNFDTLISWFSRLLFAGALTMTGLSGAEWLANHFGYTVLQGSFGPGRLFEFAAMLLLFVTVALLRQIREELRARPGSG